MAGDSYNEAQGALEQQRRDYLAAMAQAGTRGAQEYTQAQADLNGQKTAAVQAALAEAARRGAPAGMQQSIQYQTSRPFDNRVADLTSSNASHSASFGANQSAGDTVIQQAIANIPALRALSERQARELQFKQQQADQQNALDTQLKNVDLQIAQANRDRAQRGGSSGDPLGDMLKGLEIKQKLGDQAKPQNQMAVLGDAQQRLGGTASNGYRVIEAVISKAKNYNDALAGLDYIYSHDGTDGYSGPTARTPHGHPLDRGALESVLSNYYNA